MAGIDGAEATLQDVKLIFRNFEGRERQFNDLGDRNFGILLEDERAMAMKSDGWPVKQLKVRDEDKEEDPEATGDFWLKVKVKYSPKSRPPQAYLVSEIRKQRTALHEDTVKLLDSVDVAHCDVMVRAKVWDMHDGPVTTVYLQAVYVTGAEDELSELYADYPVTG